jgi:dephospho-CoA kinase
MKEGRVIVGIVGRMGSGKSLVAKILAEKYHFHRMDIDQWGHAALEEEKDRIAAAFGPEVIDAEGAVNRKTLGAIVFSDPVKLLELNAVVHPRMKADIAEHLKKAPLKRVAIDAALLFEIGLDSLCDYIVAVEAPDTDSVERAARYRGWEESRSRRVLRAQEHLRVLKDRCDFIIFNNSSLQKLRKQVEILCHVIL